MCSVPEPKIPDPVEPPKPPPPAAKMASRVENKGIRSRQKTAKKSGTSSLTVQRQRQSPVNTGSSGSGANINY